MKRIASLALFLFSAGAALAQTPAPAEPETVYSDAQREKDQLLSQKFVQSLLKPGNTLSGQFARWKTPVCAHVVGMSAAAGKVVEQRIREVAGQVGAPLDQPGCAPNIVVFVTGQQQALLDALRNRNHWLFDSGDLTVRYPAQAWYANILRDDRGTPHLDIPWEIICPECDKPPSVPANDTRLRTGIQLQMGTVVILVDSNALAGLTLGSFGDYLALMTLAQTPASARCQPARSIANLFLKDCATDTHATGLSDADQAMLISLYETPDQPEKLQMTRLIGNMQRTLEGRRK